MSKRKKNNGKKPEIEKQTGYYDLKTKAVEDLVTADESNSPEVSREELRQYQSGLGIRIPDWVKLLFIKAWFAGAVCFFFLWGLGTYLADELDKLFVTGMALGIVTEMLTNNVIRFFAKTPGAYDRWMMFPKKKFMTFFWNILYAYVVLALVVLVYTGINMVIIHITGTPADGAPPLGVEPVLFGVFCLGADMLLIEIKRLILRLFGGLKKKANQE